MIEILGQKFEEGDIIYGKLKRNGWRKILGKEDEFIGFLRKTTWIDKLFGNIFALGHHKNGKYIYWIRDIIEVKKLEVIK
mgnify:CR=1 FL=1